MKTCVRLCLSLLSFHGLTIVNVRPRIMWFNGQRIGIQNGKSVVNVRA